MSPVALPTDAAPAPPPRRRRADAQRNLGHILETATQLLAARPSASMAEIAANAGVHRATVHRHFACREDLVAAIRREAMEDTVRAVETAVAAAPGSAADRLEALTLAMLASADRYRLFAFTTWRDDHTVARAEHLQAVFADLLAAGQAEGDLRDDVDPAQLGVAFGGLVMAALPAIAAGEMDAPAAAGFVRRMLSAPAR